MPHWPKILEHIPDLGRMKKLLSRLGNPEKKIPPVVHISGTNGKGSTLAFIKYIMQAANYKVHSYTSPHFIDFNERIVIAGSSIHNNELHDLLEECRIINGDSPITFFEATTAAAFLVFSRHDADITLIEVGMGGRLDSTNIVDPILTVITSISLDHTEYLGPTLEIIAGEKAGIMKLNIPCVIAEQQESVINVLAYNAMMNKSPLYRAGFEWNCIEQNKSMVFDSSVQSIRLPLPSLRGVHQISNAGNAIAACNILSSRYGFNISIEDIEIGLKNTYWPARLEHIQEGKLVSKLPKGSKLFLDGAHNPDAAKKLAIWLEDSFNDRVYIIFGVTKNREVKDFLEHLRPYIKLLCTVCVKSESNAQNAYFIKDEAEKIGIKAVECASVSDAILNKIITDAAPKNILICGSLFLARDLHLENKLYSTTIPTR